MSGGFNPLLVSEGSADGKLATIYRSDYLTFAYASLSQHEGPLCIFGHSLSDSDRHIVDAIRASKSRTLAVSIRPGSAVEVHAQKAAFINTVPDVAIRFFDASTHPLGRPDVNN